jgi:hypothetical protein
MSQLVAGNVIQEKRILTRCNSPLLGTRWFNLFSGERESGYRVHAKPSGSCCEKREVTMYESIGSCPNLYSWRKFASPKFPKPKVSRLSFIELVTYQLISLIYADRLISCQIDRSSPSLAPFILSTHCTSFNCSNVSPTKERILYGEGGAHFPWSSISCPLQLILVIPRPQQWRFFLSP